MRRRRQLYCNVSGINFWSTFCHILLTSDFSLAYLRDCRSWPKYHLAKIDGEILAFIIDFYHLILQLLVPLLRDL